MTHGRDCPDRCSMCLAAPVRRVSQSGPAIVIDGIPERLIAPPIGRGLKQSGARGGRSTAARKVKR